MTELSPKRRGRITASRFGDVLAGKDTKRYQGYKQEIIDHIRGIPAFDEDKPWFEPGIRMEPEGLGHYEWVKGTELVSIGFQIHPKYDQIGGTPDGKINPNGLVELKCRTSLKEHLRAERMGLPSEHKPQCQGYLWITGYDWLDFISYYSKNGKRLIHIYKVYPDKEYHKKLEKRCLELWDEIQDEVSRP